MKYRLKFNTHIIHAVSFNDLPAQNHAHTWSLNAYVYENEKFDKFDYIEKIIKGVLKYFENKPLNDLDEFKDDAPTLENYSHVLFNAMKKALNDKNIGIDYIEVSETPFRSYLVRNNLPKDNTIAYLNAIKNFSADKAKVKFSLFYEQSENIQKKKSLKPEAAKALENNSSDNEVTDFSLKKSDKYSYPGLKAVVATLFLLAFGIIMLMYINLKGIYPWGSDIYGHIFKGDLLYKRLMDGELYPIYTNLWYNGIQPFRYWAPIPYYILAFLQIASKGDPIWAYNYFVVFCFFVGGFGWILWGYKEKRILTSTVIAVLWFAMPDNVRVFFSEGNVPRMVIAVVMPYLFYFIWQYVYYKKKYALVAVIPMMSIVCFCHLMIAAMLGISTFIFLLYFSLSKKEFGPSIQTLIAMLFGITLTGFWLYPAFQGGLLSMDASATGEVMKLLTFPFTQSLNPMLRLKNIEIYYFGISFFIISIIGVILAGKRSIAGFLTLLTIFIGTTTSAVPFLIKLPLNQLLWMMRFTPIAYAMFSLSMILWRDSKRFITVILLLLITVDSGISFYKLAFHTIPNDDIDQMYEISMIHTSQRIAILDCSEFGSYPSYRLCSVDKETQYAYGWAWQGATTSSNIVKLNTSLEKKYFMYMFDRSLEIGCDTVLVKKDKISLVDDYDDMMKGASSSGYNLIKTFNMGYLFKINAPDTFGVVTKYKGLSIGSSASDIVLDFPVFQIANSNCLDDFTVEELTKYKILYISGFTYNDKNYAENLLRETAKKGVSIVVDMNRVPNDPITNRLTFLGVTAQPIMFEKKLPDLHFSGHTVFPITFKKEYKNWNTVYLEDLPEIIGFSWMAGNKLAFMGKDDKLDITYIGFNLLYHGLENEDQNIIDEFGTIIGSVYGELPERKIVPLTVNTTYNTIDIDSPADNVITTLANLDAFVSDRKTKAIHNLLEVDSGHTHIDIIYPYVKKGMLLSLFGLIGSIMFLYLCFRDIRKTKFYKNFMKKYKG